MQRQQQLTQLRQDIVLCHLLHFWCFDVKYAEKDAKAKERLVKRITESSVPSTYLSPTYFNEAQQQFLLSIVDKDGNSLKSAFEKRFFGTGHSVCGPHELVPWITHFLALPTATAAIKKRYRLWCSEKDWINPKWKTTAIATETKQQSKKIKG